MQLAFVDIVDTMHRDEHGLGVTFRGRRGRYDVPAEPEDLAATLRRAHRSGSAVNVTYDDASQRIVDVTPAR